MTSNAPIEPGTLPDRLCGSCVSCCSFFAIPALAKPAGKLCDHSMAGGGCDRYDTRPSACRIFFCAWRCWDKVPLDWRPDRTGFILGGQLARGRFLSVTIDPARPGAWRMLDYYRQLKQWAIEAAAIGSQVAIFEGSRVFIIQPNEDLDLGEISPEEVLIAEQVMGPDGPICAVSKILRSDPRARG